MNLRIFLFLGIVAVCLASNARGAESLEELIKYAEQPIIIREQKTHTETVYRRVNGRAPAAKRDGLFRHRCRVMRWARPKSVAEQRTFTTEVQRSVATVAMQDSRTLSNKIIRLDAPLSAGAIAERVIARLSDQFPDKEFHLTADVDRKFPVNISSAAPAKDGMLYQFVIDPQGDPRFLDVLVFSKDPNGGESQAKADARRLEAEKALTEK